MIIYYYYKFNAEIMNANMILILYSVIFLSRKNFLRHEVVLYNVLGQSNQPIKNSTNPIG